MKKTSNYREQLKQYTIQLQPDPYRPVEEYFKCQVSNMGSVMLPMLNGWYVHEGENLTTFENGVIAGSLRAAMEKYPSLVEPCLAKQPNDKEDELTLINEEQFTDGIFIYVPDNVKVEKPFQIVSLVNTQDNLLIQNRHIISVGKNAEISIIQCDDSTKYGKTFLNVVTKIFLNENAHLHYYKTENKEADSKLFNHIYVNQESYSSFLSNAITFNAGYVCNDFHVNLNKPFAEANLYGLYLVDKAQHCDNNIVINHISGDCKSFQLYKGIMDDEAQAGFHGHVIVQPNAQRTNAFQTNRNILLTDKAHITTKPFLEIYADDVQCSHGATVGQLDEEALFYLRSRGISEKGARRLLMFAFANEIVHYVDIAGLKEKLSNMVQRRLNGELTCCDQCMLLDNDNDFIIPIDVTKINA